MTIGPPNIYLKEGQKIGVPLEIISNALAHAARSSKYEIEPILTLNHLSHLTGINYNYLRQIVERKRDPYHAFQIRKRQGGKRVICVPDQQLMIVQRWLHKNVFAKISPHHRSYAYSSGSSIVKCASEHCGNRWLVKVDIRRFFESITEKRVYRVFTSLGYNNLLSFELARICTRRSIPTQAIRAKKWIQDPSKYDVITTYRSKFLGHVPQGAPSSPMIANLVSFKLDDAIEKLSQKNSLVYTRYADDLIFSTFDGAFNRKKALTFVKAVYDILSKMGFEANTAKTVIVPPGARKLVLGLLVDRDRPKLTKQFRNSLKAHLRGIKKFGFINHSRFIGFNSFWGFHRHLKGLFSFAFSVDKDFTAPLYKDYVLEVKKSGLDIK